MIIASFAQACLLLANVSRVSDVTHGPHFLTLREILLLAVRFKKYELMGFFLNRKVRFIL